MNATSASPTPLATFEDNAASGRVAAFFDVDGTLTDTNIVQFYVRYRTAGMSRPMRGLWLLNFACWIPIFLLVDKMNRAAFNRLFYRFYRGMDADATRRLAAETFAEFPLPRLFPDAAAAVRAHQERGETVVFVTGTTSFIAQPLAAHLGVEHVLCVSLEEWNGKFTGNLVGNPLSDTEKAVAVRRFAETHGIDLAASSAYGDSSADIPMLETVGHPVAVNPSKSLRRYARKRGWQSVRWEGNLGP